MNLDNFTTVLVALVPSLTAVMTIVGGIIKVIQLNKKNQAQNNKMLEEKLIKMEKSFNDTAIIKTKIESIEKYLLDHKAGKR